MIYFVTAKSTFSYNTLVLGSGIEYYNLKLDENVESHLIIPFKFLSKSSINFKKK